MRYSLVKRQPDNGVLVLSPNKYNEQIFRLNRDKITRFFLGHQPISETIDHQTY